MNTERASQPEDWAELLKTPLRMRADLRFRQLRPANLPACMLEDLESGRSYALSPWQRRLIELLDGTLIMGDVVRQIAGEFPDLANEATVSRFIDWLREQRMIAVDIGEDWEMIKTKEGLSQEVQTVQPPKFFSYVRMAHLGMNTIAFLVFLAGVWKLSPASGPAFAGAGKAEEGTFPATAKGVAKAGAIPIRASSAGVITEVLVQDGDHVDEGDLLARIEDPRRLDAVQALRRELGECRLRRDRLFRTGEVIAYQEELWKISDITRQIGLAQADALTAEMRAPISGQIETGILCGRIGGEVADGDVLLRVFPREEVDPDLLAGAP